MKEGSFDLTGSFFDGLGGNFGTSNRKNSLSLPPSNSRNTSNNGNNGNNGMNNGNNYYDMNNNNNIHIIDNNDSNNLNNNKQTYVPSYGEVDLSAYQSMAAALQNQGEIDQVIYFLLLFFILFFLIYIPICFFFNLLF